MLMAIWIVTLIWAITVTLLFFYRNPLPFPDRGHRVFGVPDEEARRVVVELLKRVSPLKPRWTFDSSEVHQTLMWDGLTSIHYLDPAVQKSRNISGTGLSVPSKDPAKSAAEAVSFLKNAGYDASVVEGINLDLPPNHLVPIQSSAFNGWNLVFRRPLYKMPFPKIRAS